MKERNSIEIRVWMVRNKVRFVDIKRDLGLYDVKQIRSTVDGFRNHRNTLRWLLDKGCPANILDLPVDLQVAA